MPGSVQNAVPLELMPHSLCRAFGHAREYVVLESEYRNGESQRSRLVETSRKRWRLAKRLTPALLQQLRDFYDARKGPEEPSTSTILTKPFRSSPTTQAIGAAEQAIRNEDARLTESHRQIDQ